ncbi:MAG: hypothetical protein ACP5DQ_09535 [Bacteroidales bacterium]
MVYINPIEILELHEENVNSIDSNIIRKAKRKLFADIDLSDNGLLEYYEQKLTKSDCEKAIDELEDSNKFEFYFHLASNIELNKFLANGNNEFLKKPKQESIYKLPEFINFISPYITIKIDNLLLKSFQNKDFDLFTSLLRFDYLIAQHDLNNAYRSLSNEIEQRIIETDKLTAEIKDGESEFSDANIERVLGIIADKFPPEYLNKLPVYFQSQINKIAASINFLQLNIWNELDTTLVSLKLLEHLLSLNIESVKKPVFQKNYEIVKEKHFEQIEREKNAPILKEWAAILINLKEFNNQLEEGKTYQKNESIRFTNEIDIVKLNSLGSFAGEIRESICWQLRGISVSLFNKVDDLDNSIDVINKALTIDTCQSTKEKIQEDLKTLNSIKIKREFWGEPIDEAPSLHLINGCGTTIYGETLYFVLIGIPIFPIARYRCTPTLNGYRFHGKLKLKQWQVIWQILIIPLILGLIIWAANS